MNSHSHYELLCRRKLLQRLGLFNDFLDTADHVERLFRQVIVFASTNALEALDRFLERNELARRTGKDFSNVERLRQETLNLTRTGNGQLVFRRQFVHTQNRDDVTQFLVALQRHLHGTGNRVVLFTDDLRVELAGGGVERIDSRVDTQRGDVTRQHDRGVEVQEGGGRRRVGQVVSRHVNGLDRGDRADLCRGNTLLQTAHFFSQRRLVAHGRRHTAEQCGHFGTSQGVPVDVIDEEQDVTTVVTETLGHGQAGQRDAQTVTRRLVHLTEHHRDLVENVGVLHFVVEVVTFTGTLAHASKHGQTGVLLCDVVDQFHHVDRLAHAGTAEQADLAALGERADQIDHLDAGFQQINRRRQLVELRRSGVDRANFVASDRAGFVDRATEHVHDAAQGAVADRHGNGCTGVVDLHAAAQAVGRTHGDGTDHAVTQLLLNLKGQTVFGHTVGFGGIQLACVIDLGHRVARELDVHDGADALNNGTLTHIQNPQKLKPCVKQLRRRRRFPTIPSDRKSTRLNSSHIT